MSKITINKKYGCLTAIRVVDPHTKGGEMWEFLCDCGRTIRRQDYRVCDCNIRHNRPMCDTCRNEIYDPCSRSLIVSRNSDRHNCKYYLSCLDKVMKSPVKNLPSELKKRDHVCISNCDKYEKREDSAVEYASRRKDFYYT